MRDQEMQLSNYCRWNESKSVQGILNKHNDLDLTIKNGLCFIFAIKYQNIEMLKSLLDYYEKTKLQGDRDSMEYKAAKYTLRQILEDAIEQYNVTSDTAEIQEVLRPYVTTDDCSTEDIESLKDGATEDSDDISHKIEDSELMYSNLSSDLNIDSNIFTLTAENLTKLNNEKQSSYELIGCTANITHDDEV